MQHYLKVLSQHLIYINRRHHKHSTYANPHQQQTATEATNLSLLADELALPAQGVAIAVSNQMVPRTAWDATPLHEGDNVIIIKAACGG